MGSPLYMSPEQVQSAKNVDARTDLWALGVILFELLTGELPFPGSAFGDVAVKIAVDKPASLRSLRADVPEALEAVILRCLAKDRNARFANVAELSRALLPFAPARCSGTVERIVGILQTAGIPVSPSMLPPAPAAEPSPALVRAWGVRSRPLCPPHLSRLSPLPHAALTAILRIRLTLRGVSTSRSSVSGDE